MNNFINYFRSISLQKIAYKYGKTIVLSLRDFFLRNISYRSVYILFIACYDVVHTVTAEVRGNLLNTEHCTKGTEWFFIFSW